jgi:hypothetical protein
MSRQLAENRESLGLELRNNLSLKKAPAWKNVCSKVRDREDALAST